MKKILIFSLEYFPYVGGAEVAVREITKRNKDFEFTLLTCWNDRHLPREEMIDGVRVIRVGVGRRKIDKYLFAFWAPAVAQVWHGRRRFDLVWAIMANQAGLAALLFRLVNYRMPYLLTLQEGDPPEYYFRRVWFWYPLYRRIYLKANCIQAISRFLAERARGHGYQGPIKIIPNGVDLSLFVFGARLRRDKLVVITVSRLVKKNGVDILIKALADLKKRGRTIKCLIVGGGKEELFLKNLARDLGTAEEITFAGEVAASVVPTYLAAADIFVRPSLSEGLGSAFLEAMAAGLITIGTPVGGIVDFLRDRETGFLVTPEDPKVLADKLAMIMDNINAYQKVATDGRKLVEQYYSWEKIAGQMKNIFEILVGYRL